MVTITLFPQDICLQISVTEKMSNSLNESLNTVISQDFFWRKKREMLSSDFLETPMEIRTKSCFERESEVRRFDFCEISSRSTFISTISDLEKAESLENEEGIDCNRTAASFGLRIALVGFGNWWADSLCCPAKSHFLNWCANSEWVRFIRRRCRILLVWRCHIIKAFPRALYVVSLSFSLRGKREPVGQPASQVCRGCRDEM